MFDPCIEHLQILERDQRRIVVERCIRIEPSLRFEERLRVGVMGYAPFEIALSLRVVEQQLQQLSRRIAIFVVARLPVVGQRNQHFGMRIILTCGVIEQTHRFDIDVHEPEGRLDSGIGPHPTGIHLVVGDPVMDSSVLFVGTAISRCKEINRSSIQIQ